MTGSLYNCYKNNFTAWPIIRNKLRIEDYGFIGVHRNTCTFKGDPEGGKKVE
jgi:hypothetical protein